MQIYFNSIKNIYIFHLIILIIILPKYIYIFFTWSAIF